MKKSMWLNELKTLLLTPEIFFKNVSSEKGKKKPLLWAIVGLFLYILFGALITLFAISIMQNLAPNVESFDAYARIEEKRSEVWMDVVLSIVLFILGIITLPVSHFLATKLGGKGTFDQTFKISLYSSVPIYLFGWIPILGILGSIWGLYTYYTGFKLLHKMKLSDFVKFSIATLIFDIFIILLLIIFFGVIAIVIYGLLA